MKFLPRAVKNELRVVRFLNKKLNFTKGSLHCVVKFISKSLISSKGNAGKEQNLHYTWKSAWKFPCTRLAMKHMARNMEMSMYLVSKHIAMQWNIWQGTNAFQTIMGFSKITILRCQKGDIPRNLHYVHFQQQLNLFNKESLYSIVTTWQSVKIPKEKKKRSLMCPTTIKKFSSYSRFSWTRKPASACSASAKLQNTGHF